MVYDIMIAFMECSWSWDWLCFSSTKIDLNLPNLDWNVAKNTRWRDEEERLSSAHVINDVLAAHRDRGLLFTLVDKASVHTLYR